MSDHGPIPRSLVQPWYPVVNALYCPYCGQYRPTSTFTYTTTTGTGDLDPDLDVTALDLLGEPEAMRPEEV